MRNGIRDLTTFAFVPAALDAHSDELGRAFDDAHDRMPATSVNARSNAAYALLFSSTIRGTRARPVAITTKESLVDVSPSTVMQLKEASAAALTARSSALALTGASVATNPSMVAMFGRIIPAPFAMPVTVKVPPSVS